MRAGHAANDSKIFEWRNPPATGHPGEDFNCRCWAEPILDGAGETYVAPDDGVQVAGLGKVVVEIIQRVMAKRAARQAAERAARDAARKPKPPAKPTKPQTLNPEKVEDILYPNGKPLGKPGNGSRVRIQDGGDKAARELYERLSKGGKSDTPPTYPGKGTRLPDGDWVGYRPNSKSGPSTVDVNVDGVPFKKIHFPE